MKYVALLRGINVGGKSIVKMADLKRVVEACGFDNVRTYIQSGNVLFESTGTTHDIARQLESNLTKHFGADWRVVVKTQKELHAILRQVPKDWVNGNHLRRYLAFVLEPKTARDVVKEITLKEAVDSVESGKGVVYMSTILAGISTSGFSKLSAKPTYKYITIRNYSTVQKLLQIMET